MSPNAGKGGLRGLSNEYRCAHGAQRNFGDLTPYLTYDCRVEKGSNILASFWPFRKQQQVLWIMVAWILHQVFNLNSVSPQFLFGIFVISIFFKVDNSAPLIV
jgi:hypothetical protein